VILQSDLKHEVTKRGTDSVVTDEDPSAALLTKKLATPPVGLIGGCSHAANV